MAKPLLAEPWEFSVLSSFIEIELKWTRQKFNEALLTVGHGIRCWAQRWDQDWILDLQKFIFVNLLSSCAFRTIVLRKSQACICLPVHMYVQTPHPGPQKSPHIALTISKIILSLQYIKIMHDQFFKESSTLHLYPFLSPQTNLP